MQDSKRSVVILEAGGRELGNLVRTFRTAVGTEMVLQVVCSREELWQAMNLEAPNCLAVVDSLLGDGDQNGLEIIRSLHTDFKDLPIIAVAEQGSVQEASAAIRAGATDFLVRGPVLAERVATVLVKVQKHFALLDENQALQAQQRYLQEIEQDRYQIISCSSQMRKIVKQIEKVSSIPRPVLITGERGTGKELVARAIRSAGSLAEKPFVTVNCAAFTDTLLENELFGHERGAFTGASTGSPGKFEQARGGVLFLDEIGNMSLAFQQKILRVVEYGVFTRVGGSKEIHVDVRLISATNADLKSKMNSGQFLRDLYDRLTFEIIHVDPLRDRPEDIEILAQYFLEEFMKEIPALQNKTLSCSALDLLKKYDFPGNVRELKNIIERAAYRDTTNEITPEDLGLNPEQSSALPGGTFEEKVEAFKKNLVVKALADADGNQARAARNLGLSYHKFRYLYNKHLG
jgi:DNA-binding NtrC family response regulator